jgi:hypothetical protein
VHLLPSGTVIVSDIERGLFAFDASASASVGPWGSSAMSAARLLPAWPNPFRDRVQLGFDLPTEGTASLKLLNASGDLVTTLAEGWFPANRTRLAWSAPASGRRIASGVHYLLLETPAGRASRRIVLAR